MSNGLMVQEKKQDFALMPVIGITQAIERRNTVINYTRKLMVKNTDYGEVPGTSKDTLLKPGAEKLCTLFGLTPKFEVIETVEDWGKDADEPLFFYRYRCKLYQGDVLFGEGVGSCNSREKKYRYRNASLICPDCGQDLRKSKNSDGFYCWTKAGGCGGNYKVNDERVASQTVGKVLNDDIFSQVNTIDKMAQKRALIAAVLITTNASEFFTQDIEDMEIIEAEYHEVVKPAQKKNNNIQAQPKQPQMPRPWSPDDLRDKINSFVVYCYDNRIEMAKTQSNYHDVAGGTGEAFPIDMHPFGPKTANFLSAKWQEALKGVVDNVEAAYHDTLYKIFGVESSRDLKAVEAAAMFRVLFNGSSSSELKWDMKPLEVAGQELLSVYVMNAEPPVQQPDLGFDAPAEPQQVGAFDTEG